MNITHKLLVSLATALAFIPLPAGAAAQKEPRVTQVIREVNLLPSDKDSRPAEVNDRVPEDTAVRTGDKSRSELTFADLTISRLGANTIYSYARGGRNIDLGGGSVLLRVPKDSGGASVRSSAVSVAVTGTTLILESSRGGRSKLLVSRRQCASRVDQVSEADAQCAGRDRCWMCRLARPRFRCQ